MAVHRGYNPEPSLRHLQHFPEERHMVDGDKKPHRLLRYFKYEHLPAQLQARSKPFCDLAESVMYSVEIAPLLALLVDIVWEGVVVDEDEKGVALSKLTEAGNCLDSPDELLRLVLEAKDCFVRSFIPED